MKLVVPTTISISQIRMEMFWKSQEDEIEKPISSENWKAETKIGRKIKWNS